MTAGRKWFPLTGAVLPSDRGFAAAVRATTATRPVDPITGPKLALAGCVVTMDDAFAVKRDGIVYLEAGCIASVRDRAERAPAGFEEVRIVETGGTIFPGLIELHNHLSYNVLPRWTPVPRRFQHRGQWPNHKDYRPLISGPMTVIGQYRDSEGKSALLPALVRYVECKCLLGGVTTSQGVKLASNAGIQRFYRGIVRNVEQTDDADLPEAQGRIPDVAAKDARSFLARLNKEDSCFLLHLSEGITDAAEPLSMARKHFLALEVAPGQWALNKAFTGIHAAGMLPEDFEVLAGHSGSMVWSPLSNLLLYGATARVDSAKAAGIAIGLGSDWSPSGSKNLLGELKVAWLHNELVLNRVFSARDLVAMATREAARILKWEKCLGTVETGKRADFLIVGGASADPYDALIHARETDILLVMINGVARYGVAGIMDMLAPGAETLSVGGETRRLFLEQEFADPDVAQVSLSTAADRLTEALRDIAKLAREIETSARPRTRAVLDAPFEPVWVLALDETSGYGVDFSPRLPFDGPGDFTGPDRFPRAVARDAPALSTILRPIVLDPLTVADDEDFLHSIEGQPNVPEAIRTGLRALY